MDKTQIDYNLVNVAEIGTMATFVKGAFCIYLCKITSYSWHLELTCVYSKNHDIAVNTYSAITNMEVFCLLDQLDALDVELTKSLYNERK